MTEEDTEQQDRDLALLRKHASQLSEHFDSVQIFATRYQGDDGGTINAQLGAGNWFARYGQVANWLKKQDADPGDGEGEEVEE